MLRKVLIANRGEIAVRIARACRELGITSVMIYSDADRNALHVRSGDEACYVGLSPAADSYLRGDKIIELALAAGCDAIHPGYGFLAENASFAAAVAEAGIIWIGPPPAAIALMGSKIESKRLAQAQGVPLVPGYFGDDQTLETLTTEARRIGCPLLVKASAGGGGKGMRVVASEDGLEEAIQGARREATAAFGDDALMLEKYLTSPRHIEVQVLGDLYGNLIHLGERDCTIQRRHQKVVEESPSPVVDNALRQSLTASALALAKAAGYSSAGTVEFIFQDGSYYFLEMNTRIQVEHPVTEEALGVDLIQAQLQIAAGESLDLVAAKPRFGRHAFEARLYAEDPTTGFLPSVGPLKTFRLPAQVENVRIDAGVAQGDAVTPYYDPLLAKIVTSGADRPTALRTMQNALLAVEVVGVRTNLGFLRWLFAHPAFAEGNFSTRFIEENYRPECNVQVPPVVLLAACFALIEFQPSPAVQRDVWGTYGWRQGRQKIPLRLVAAGIPVRICLSAQAGDSSHWNYELESEGTSDQTGECTRQILGTVQSEQKTISINLSGTDDTAICTVQCTANGELNISYNGLFYPLRVEESLSSERLQKHISATDDDTLASPMPGKVLSVLVAPKDEVAEDQPLVVIEAMKMEFTVRAPHDGRIGAVNYEPGAQVAVGDILIEMEKTP